MEHAIKERDKLKMKARTAKWSINVAAGLQIFLGSLTTGLSAIRLNGQKVRVLSYTDVSNDILFVYIVWSRDDGVG